jgi:hypothetical protein
VCDDPEFEYQMRRSTSILNDKMLCSSPPNTQVVRSGMKQVPRFLAFTTTMYLTYLAFFFYAQHCLLELGNEDEMHPSPDSRLIRLFSASHASLVG